MLYRLFSLICLLATGEGVVNGVDRNKHGDEVLVICGLLYRHHFISGKGFKPSRKKLKSYMNVDRRKS